MKKSFFVLILLYSGIIYGSNSVSVPERLFHMTGADINVTQGNLLYQSQAAGYYTGGGGVVVRSPVKNAQLVGVHLPNLPNAGCGGIDIYTGGFSFISKDQLVDTLKAVSSNAAGYAFMLGIESVSPMAANVTRQLQSWANTVNGIGINSCETAAALVGSVWPANDMASQHICRTANTSNPLYGSYIEGRHQCNNQQNKKRNQGNQDKHFSLGTEYNIAWEALMSQPFFKSPENKQLAEMYMTLVGTFVVKEDSTPKFYFSKADDNEFLTNLLEGGKITKYGCKDTKCLVIEEKEIDVGTQDCWFVKIRKSLEEIQSKIIADIPLVDAEKGLLQTSRLPLYKIVNVLSAYHRGKTCTTELDNLADIISWDVLAQILNEAIETARRGCLHLRATNMYSVEVDGYMNDLEHVRTVVRRYEEHARRGIDLEMRLIQKMQLLEKQINSEIMVN